MRSEERKKTRRLTLSAMLSAFCVVTLYIASVWPTGLYGLVAFASLFVAAAVIEAGPVSGIYVFIISSALGLLLLPNKSAPLLFLLFFGYYPVLKNLIERIGGTGQGRPGNEDSVKWGQERMGPRGAGNQLLAVQWFLKLLLFNVALTVIWVFLKESLMGFSERFSGVWIIYVLGNVVFILFDYGYSNLLLLYLSLVSRRIR